ncbi:MAG: J domain-containing protein [Planctomycetes bacterium]|nr:J domain-containing protein [Planctomycetota bacterium]
MSTHELDSDWTRWPTDPYQLLGVRPGVQARDLRRAYTRLIRTYKPEQYPEQFRRIRDAYEAILRHVEMYGRWSGSPQPTPAEEEPPEELPPPTPLESETDESPTIPETSSSGQTPTPRPRVPNLEEELAELWQRACSWEEETAYRRLVELHQRHPANQDIYLRLYWLSALVPELDPEVTACDWLARGLRATGLTGPLRELYRREITADPEAALRPSSTQLLECPARAGLIADFAGWRWQAAGRLEQWDVIGNDLQILRRGVALDEEEIWVRLLLAAVDQLAWAKDKTGRVLRKRCYEEIEQLPHLGDRLNRELDHVELLREVSAAWRALEPDHWLEAELADLIPLSWTRSLTEVRAALLKVLKLVAQQPLGALETFDNLRPDQGAVLAQLGRVLVQFQNSLATPPRDRPLTPALTRCILDFLDGTSGLKYLRVVRPRLLEFCLREAVAPEMVARTVDDNRAYRVSATEHLSQKLRTDWPLQYVYLACQLFWA